ncbi:DMT family transporter [Flavobacterium psychrotrophum]|uniref:DMT family transporter n=1 Tax=Flavobacterium psychrotrophum TaxID=2294119 RepID=UPI000E31C8A1|nr:DMT family transporter [Flavobacterium psychrotrophum]
MPKKNIYLILLSLGTALWGISFSVTKLAVQESSLYIFLFYRFSLATVILCACFYKYFKETSSESLLGGVKLALPLTAGIMLQTLGLKYLPASQCTFIAGICVVMVPVLKWGVYKMSVSAKIWIASLVALAGLCIISVSDTFTINQGAIYTILGTFGFSMYLILVEKQATKGNIITTVVPMFAACTVLSLCFAVTEPAGSWVPANNNFWMAVIYCAVFTTAFMYTVSMMAQKYIPAERVAIIYLFEPVFGAIAAFFILNEDLSWRLFIGGGLILAATFVAELNIKNMGFRKGIRTNKIS